MIVLLNLYIYVRSVERYHVKKWLSTMSNQKETEIWFFCLDCFGFFMEQDEKGQLECPHCKSKHVSPEDEVQVIFKGR